MKLDVTGNEELQASAPAVAATPRRGIGGPTLEQIFVFVSPLTLLAAWEASARLGLIDTRIFSSPTAVAMTMIEMIEDGTLATHVLATLTRFACGAILGA